MKKIGILTYIHSDNYGALLQGYALKKALTLLGGEVVMLNYRGLLAKLNIKQMAKMTCFPVWNFRIKKNFK